MADGDASSPRLATLLNVLLVLLLAIAAACAPEPAPPPASESDAADSAQQVEEREETPASPRVATLTGEAKVHLEEMVERFGERVAGTLKEQETALWLAEELSEAGLDVTLQRFPLPVQDGAVVIHREPEIAMPGLVQTGSAKVTVRATLVDANTGSPEDLDRLDVGGKLLLLRRGEEALGARAEAAEQRGAVGLIVYNEIPSLFREDLGASLAIPVVGISRSRGDQLRKHLSRSEVEITVRADQYSQNVIASTGAGGPVVVLGAHYDSVETSPGANDNATGIAVLLVLARILAPEDLPFQIRFVAWGAEERQLVGSKYYVLHLTEGEADRIALMINFDSIGKGPLAVDGTEEVVDYILEAADQEGIHLVHRKPRAGTLSDHVPFADQGVPYAYFFGTVLNRIHTPEDTLDDVEILRLGEAVAIALDTLSELAALPSLEDALPGRGGASVGRDAAVAETPVGPGAAPPEPDEVATGGGLG